MAPRRVLFAFATFSLVVLGLPLGLQSPAGAATDEPIATWDMNEAADASVMGDSSGNGLTGDVGDDVTTGITFDGATGYRFPYATPNTPPALPEHPVVVPHSSLLNPGTGDFAVTIRYRTTHSFGNIIQKGQSSAAGGYFKFENPGGVVTCLFRGESGSRGASAGRDLSDGAWHTIRCERTDAGVKMTVDGVVTGNVLGVTGSIANDRPISIGGKLNCDQVAVTCDYFSGDIDYVKIEGPGSTADVTPPSTPAKPTVASPASGRAVVTWPASTDNVATSITYSVFRNGGSTAVGTVTSGSTGTISFTENGRTPGSTHTYRVRASDGTNTSPLSPKSDILTIAGPVTDVTPPSTPATPSVASPASGRAVVTWPASTDNLATTLTYSVFRNGGSTAVGTFTGGTTGTISFTENGLTPGSTHTYRVRASDGTNTSALSPVSAALVITSAPATGTLNPITVDGTLITVSGTANDPDGAPIVRIDTESDGRTSRRESQSVNGSYNVAWTARTGTRTVCVSVLDTPTGVPTPLGCSDVVVK